MTHAAPVRINRTDCTVQEYRNLSAIGYPKFDCGKYTQPGGKLFPLLDLEACFFFEQRIHM